MTARALTKSAIFVALVALAACGQKSGPAPYDISNTAKEFAFVPHQPLERPASYSALPQPTPGGRNLADPTPRTGRLRALQERFATMLAGSGT